MKDHRDYFGQVYANKLDNLEKTDKCLETEPAKTESWRSRISKLSNNKEI